MRHLILSALITSAAFAAAPASAQPQAHAWRIQPVVQRQIQNDINQLDRRIQRAEQRRVISPREAQGLRRQAMQVKRLHLRFSRNGLTRQEVAQLEAQVNIVHQRLRLERRDWDGRRR